MKPPALASHCLPGLRFTALVQFLGRESSQGPGTARGMPQSYHPLSATHASCSLRAQGTGRRGIDESFPFSWPAARPRASRSRITRLSRCRMCTFSAQGIPVPYQSPPGTPTRESRAGPRYHIDLHFFLCISAISNGDLRSRKQGGHETDHLREEKGGLGYIRKNLGSPS